MFHYTHSKLHENAVTFNQYYSNFTYRFITFHYIQYNYVTCNLATIFAAKLIRKENRWGNNTDEGWTVQPRN